jgi:ribosomal protein S18 acetylase RimI-like enzyme
MEECGASFVSFPRQSLTLRRANPLAPSVRPVAFSQCRYNGCVSFSIRQFEKRDFETLWQIDQACFDLQLAYSRPELAFYMRRPSAFTLVAEKNVNGIPAAPGKAIGSKSGNEHRILGFIVAEKRRTTGHIITIDVIAEARRIGVGSALLDAAERRLREEGAAGVELETAVNNEAAIRFYKQKGYFVEKTIRGYYSNHLDALVMGKILIDSKVQVEGGSYPA